jgi:hypothetical protein
MTNGARPWNYLWYDGPTRRSKRIGTKQEFPTKAAAWKEVDRLEIQAATPASAKKVDTVRDVVEKYEKERMPTRRSTVRVYRCFLRNHVLPKWGEDPIETLQPRPVELWLRQLLLSPKSRTHVRSLLHALVEFAMWAGVLNISRNPISLVRNIGATQRIRKARSLTVEQFRFLLEELQEPFATMALLSVCLGLRISEALALAPSTIFPAPFAKTNGYSRCATAAPAAVLKSGCPKTAVTAFTAGPISSSGQSSSKACASASCRNRNRVCIKAGVHHHVMKQAAEAPAPRLGISKCHRQRLDRNFHAFAGSAVGGHNHLEGGCGNQFCGHRTDRELYSHLERGIASMAGDSVSRTR